MVATLTPSSLIRLATNFPIEAPAFAQLAGGGVVALTAKAGGTETVQVFNDAGAPVGAPITLGTYSGVLNDNAFGYLLLAGLTGGGFVAVTTDSTVHSGQGDIVARVYSAAGALQATLVVDSAPTGASEFAPSVVATADGGFQVVWSDSSSRGSQTFSAARPVPTSDPQTTTQGQDVFAHAFAPVNGTWQSKTAGDVQVNPSGFFTNSKDQATETWTQASARLANGNVVVAYNDQPLYNGYNGYFDTWNASGGVSFNVLAPDAQPIVSRTVVRNDHDATTTNNYNYISRPSVSAAGNGFAFLYEERELPQGKDLYEGVHLHFYNADGTSASADVLVSPVGTSAFYAKATALPNGAGVAVLYSTENSSNVNVTRNLYMETFDTSGHVLTGPTLVTGLLTRPGGSNYPQANYQLATRADGAVQVVWEERDASTGRTNLQSELFTFAPTVTLPAAVATAEANVLRVDPNAASSQALNATLVNQSQTAAVATIVAAAVSTSSVADLDYQFFTGRTPSTAGMDYLVSPTGPNLNNLNSAYYAQFSTTNRYINFASNLGKVGEGAAAFQANYGALSLTDPAVEQGEVANATDAKLRGCDLVKLRVSDVAPGGVLRQRATVIQQKTGRPTPFEITDPTRQALTAWLTLRGRRADDWLFPSRSRPGEHISTRQYARLVDHWVAMIDLEPRAYGAHSLRRTKVALVYKKTGELGACQFLLGRRKLESTVRYLGIEVDDALALSEQVAL